ncbi:MAG: LexA family protein [Ktedonobacteraceae bacterium]
MDFSRLPGISAGFPSPGELHAESRLDANDLLQPDEATYFLRVDGHSMQNACISDGDILFVTRDLSPVHGDLIVARLLDGLALRRLQVFDGHLLLEAGHPDYAPIVVTTETDYECWGVVLFVISPRHTISRSRLARQKKA